MVTVLVQTLLQLDTLLREEDQQNNARGGGTDTKHQSKGDQVGHHPFTIP